MHYCFLSTGSWEGNASFVRLRELGRELISRGLRVSYLVDDVPYNRDQLKLPDGADVRLVPRGGLFAQTLARRRLLKELSPDFVHVLNPYIKAFLTLAMTRHNVVGDWDEWPARRPYPLPRKLLEKFLDRWLRRRAALVVVASRYLKEQFQLLDGTEATYIPYATYLQDQTDGQSPFSEPTAVYMGNFYPAYDHDLLFDAARLLKDRGRPFRLMLIGGGPEVEKWRAYARDHGLEDSVSVPGFVGGADLWNRLRHAHVLLFPIRHTLLNLCRCPSKTYAYAQARRPIIANRIGEVAQVLGEQATYVEPTAQAFADALDDALSSPRVSEVDYAVERQNWSARADALLAALPRAR